jgi:hypothetical protein
MKIGTKVKIKKKYVQWTLDNVDMFQVNGRLKPVHYEELALWALAAYEGKEPKGKVTKLGNDGCLGVQVKFRGLNCFLYIDKKDLVRA